MTEREETPAWRLLWAACYSLHVACCVSSACDHMAESEERADALYQKIEDEVRAR